MSLVSIRKKGSLYKLPVKGIVKKWNRRWFVLHCTTIEGVVRLEYFDSESYEATAMGKRTIPLRQCRDLSPTSGTKTHPYVFQFTTPMGHHVFAADTHKDMEEWMSAMQEAINEDRQRNRRKKAQSLIVPQQQDPQRNVTNLSASGTSPVPLTLSKPEVDPQETYEPNNSGTYRVTLEQNELARRLKFTGMIYNLDITPETITLVDASSGADVAQWRYRQIRTYGKSSGKFNFECGRTADTGSGTFVFKTTCAKEIFGVVHRNIKKIRTELEHDRREGGRERAGEGARMTKDTSLMEVKTQPPPKPAPEKADFRTHQPMRPMPYKPKKREEKSMDIGTYRRSKEFGSPPSYEEVQAAEPIKEESEKETEKADEEQKDPSSLYTTVDKNKKKTKQDAQTGAESKSASAHENSASTVQESKDPFGFLPTASSPKGKVGEKDGLENPFQLDPFLFSPQPGANSFDVPPGTDPFTIPPLPPADNQADLGGNLGGGATMFDDLGQLDSSTGGGFDVFNFPPPLIEAGPSATNGTANLSPIAGNPAGNVSGLDMDLDLLDDRLFDTLAQLDIDGHDGGKQDLIAAKDQRPPPPPAASGTTAPGRQPMKQKQLSKQEFDDLWDGICATIPSTDS